MYHAPELIDLSELAGPCNNRITNPYDRTTMVGYGIVVQRVSLPKQQFRNCNCSAVSSYKRMEGRARRDECGQIAAGCPVSERQFTSTMQGSLLFWHLEFKCLSSMRPSIKDG